MIYLSLVWFVLDFLFNFSVNSINESTFFSDTFYMCLDLLVRLW